MTQAQIDQALQLMLAKDVEAISRSRAGDGFRSRGGQLYKVYFEDFSEDESPLSEAQMRSYLAEIDLDNFSERYVVAALQILGVDVLGAGQARGPDGSIVIA